MEETICIQEIVGVPSFTESVDRHVQLYIKGDHLQMIDEFNQATNAWDRKLKARES